MLCSRKCSNNTSESSKSLKKYHLFSSLRKRLTARNLILCLVSIIILVQIGLGFLWSKEPFLLDTSDRIIEDFQGNYTGYRTVKTLRDVAQTLLNKPGGYLSNDRFSVGILLDNIPNWEYGVLTQVRDLTRALRKDFSRSQSQSIEDSDLAKAEPHFNFDNNSWFFPSSESEYQKGINSLDSYLNRLLESQGKSALFYARADNLNNWLSDVLTRLGSLSQRLSASAGVTNPSKSKKDIDSGLLDPMDSEKTLNKTPWLKVDDVFYEARGATWALLNFFSAIEVDFKSILIKKNALVSIQQIIRELELSQKSILSPMILNGSGYALFANHSLVIANYISRANAAIMDLHQLLSQG